MVLVIASLLDLLCMLYSSLGSSNQMLHSRYKLSVSLTLNPCVYHNVNEVYQLFPKIKLSWREQYAEANLIIQ